jgi:hypothetical protein
MKNVPGHRLSAPLRLCGKSNFCLEFRRSTGSSEAFGELDRIEAMLDDLKSLHLTLRNMRGKS